MDFFHRLLFKLSVFLFLLSLTSCKNHRNAESFPIHINFEKSPLGHYNLRSIKADWPNSKMLWGKKNSIEYALGLTPSYAEVIVENNNRALKINYPAKEFGPLVGTQWKSSFMSVDEAVLSYKIYIPIGFDFAKGGKLPGLAGGNGNAGGNIPNGYDGWSARLMFHEDGGIAHYLYYPDQSTAYGEYHFWAIDSTRIKLPVGRWVELTHYLKMNSPKMNDGKLYAWIDGVNVLSIDSLRFRDTSSLAIDQILFSTFYGGDGPEWAPQEKTFILFDDFYVSVTDSIFTKGK